MIAIMSQPTFCKVKLTVSTFINAERFAEEQRTKSKAKQVYFNTLAISAVNTYLRISGWETSLENSNSWNREARVLLDASDLFLPGYGRIECRPATSDEEKISISPESSSDTIAHVGIRLKEQQKYAEILGFVADPKTDRVSISELRPIEDFASFLENYSEMDTSCQMPKLSDWLSGIVQSGWQNLERFCQEQAELFPGSQKQFVFRSAVESQVPVTSENLPLRPSDSRVKLWHLGQGENLQTVALIVELSAQQHDSFSIGIKVCPTAESHYLPPGLKVDILDELKEPVLQAHIKPDNDIVEFFLDGRVGESFSIQAIFEEKIFSESFMI